MTAALGHSCVLLALALALWGIAAPILYARTGVERLQVSARYAVAGQFLFVTAAAGALIYALVATDFSIRYVAFNTTRATPIYYRVTGLWGALEGRCCCGSGSSSSSPRWWHGATAGACGSSCPGC